MPNAEQNTKDDMDDTDKWQDLEFATYLCRDYREGDNRSPLQRVLDYAEELFPVDSTPRLNLTTEEWHCYVMSRFVSFLREEIADVASER